MSNRDNFHYKAMDWYDLLGFSRNEMNNTGLTRGEYCSKYLEVAYQNCLSMLDRNDLAEINSFYKIQTLNYCSGKIENIEELREKITEAYNILKDPQKSREYEFEIFGIFCREYPEDEMADNKFKDRAIYQEEREQEFELDSNAFWKKYLSLDYWKNWREKIVTAKYKEEIKFYIRKRDALRMFILKSTGWKEEKVSANVLDSIKKKEKRLQDISKEEWDKKQNQPPRDGELREMSAKEISKMFSKFLPTYGWNFDEGQHDKPANNEKLNEKDYKNIVLDSKKELSQWMKKNEVEEVFCNKSSNELVCKKNNGLCDSFITIKIDEVGVNSFCERFGESSINRQELENELNFNNFNNSQKEANDFSLNPWLVGGGILFSVSFLFFKFRTRKNYK